MDQTFEDNVIPALLAARQAGAPGALVTLVGKSASGPRPLGSQLAVTADGRVTGLISGGCVEGGIVAEARAAMQAGTNRMVRFGTGSRYVDLRLPCGGAIDVHVDVTVETATLASVQAAVAARRAVILETDTVSGTSRVADPGPEDRAAFASCDLIWADDRRFRRACRPTPRLVLAGRGPVVPLAARMAVLNGYEVVLMTDDEAVAAQGGPLCAAPVAGLAPGAIAGLAPDAATAVVTLFHDHAVEHPVLRRALDSPAFYIGAMGSRATHARRLDRLRSEGYADDALARIDGPAGVPIHAASPAEVATSVMAGVIRAWRLGRPLPGLTTPEP